MSTVATHENQWTLQTCSNTLIRSPRRIITRLFLSALTCMVAGCTPSALGPLRSKLQAGNYTAAREELTRLSAHADTLSPDERREVKDDLCITDYALGRNAVPLKEQRRACAQASREPGSKSAELLARINQEIAVGDAEMVEAALKTGDLAGAEAAAEDYEATPGASQAMIADWSQRMWKLVEEKQQTPTRGRKAAIAATVAELKRDHPEVRKMNDTAFTRWLVTAGTVKGEELVHSPKFNDGVLKLKMSELDLPSAALNLDRFANINDAAVARCGCDARTEIGIGPGRLPAYVVRVDTDNRRSEVLVLLSGKSVGPRVSMR